MGEPAFLVEKGHEELRVCTCVQDSASGGSGIEGCLEICICFKPLALGFTCWPLLRTLMLHRWLVVHTSPINQSLQSTNG